MVKKLRKYMLQPGNYQDGNGRDVEVTPERLRHWKTGFDQLTANNYTVPAHWDHGDVEHDVIPLSVTDYRAKKRSAANTVGALTGFELHDEGRGGVEIEVEVHDDKAASAAEANHIHLSPVILDNWEDGRKNKYADVITHMDFVNLPSDNSQTPFEPVPGMVACCGLRMSSSPTLAAGSGILLFARPDDDDDYDEDLVDLEDEQEEMTDETDDALGEEEEVDEIPDELVGDDEFDMGDLGEDLDMGLGEEIGGGEELSQTDDEDQLIEEVRADLEALDLVAPTANPFDDPAGWIKQFCASLKQRAVDDGAGGEEGGFEEFSEEDVEVQEPDFATMGLDPKTTTALKRTYKAVDSRAQAAEKRAEEAEKRAAAADARTIKMSRQTQVERIEAVLKTGRCTPPEAKEKRQEAGVIKMSLDRESGEPRRTSLDVWLESRESLPEGAVWDSEQRLKMSVVSDPPDGVVDGEDMTPEKAKQYNDALAKRMPGQLNRGA